MLKLSRNFHTRSPLLVRTRFTKPKPKPEPSKNPRKPTQTSHHLNTLKVTAPIPPTTANSQFITPETHPLWQFFHDKKFLRSQDELDTKSRPWSIPELRRKSFNDLHSLWLTALRERNVLARESHLLHTESQDPTDPFSQVAEKCRVTMWRIRHVLSERHWSYVRTKDIVDPVQLQEEVAHELLQCQEEDAFYEMLERCQWALFGISEVVQDNLIDAKFVKGVKFVANLKLQWLLKQRDIMLQDEENVKKVEKILQGGPIEDIAEAFVVFTASNDVNSCVEACDAIEELRMDSNNKIHRYDEIETMSKYIKQLKKAESLAEPILQEEGVKSI
ncbi:hypothetical protein NCAS_0J01970 [Naumovozyma castellii]|uniref:Large ribosomal subunit protein uL29m n=1 Tax=Naumovozyma castellii TaxID=27288 RepID=G0VKY8_NAUCA|nr:hypothetical protein NCAS_0J01970 [Naumovozyma castellii CBS 4309]CCC72176.1 hypothetical protein NCAS_0J01970 [Naumovozyma castellii CBS 4309]